MSDGHDPVSFRRGIRYATTWLHERAKTMNDPHAKAILDSAAFALGRRNAETAAQKGEDDG